MIDHEARAVLTLLTHLFDQSIQLNGNHAHRAVISPQLQKARESMGLGHVPPPHMPRMPGQFVPYDPAAVAAANAAQQQAPAAPAPAAAPPMGNDGGFFSPVTVTTLSGPSAAHTPPPMAQGTPMSAAPTQIAQPVLPATAPANGGQPTTPATTIVRAPGGRTRADEIAELRTRLAQLEAPPAVVEVLGNSPASSSAPLPKTPEQEATEAIVALYGIPEGPGCATCKRTPAELIGGGHAVGCPARPG